MLFLTTTGSNVEVPELGISIVHPTTDFQIDSQFDSDEIRSASSLTAAIQAGTLIWRKTAAGPIQPANNYDPDYLQIELEKSGTGVRTIQELTLAATTIDLTLSDESVFIFSGTTAGQILRLPNCTTAQAGKIEYTIFNRGTQPITVNYQDNSNLFIVPVLSKTVLTLQHNGTANGDWFLVQSFNNIASGILNYKATSSTTFTTNSATDVLITGFSVTPQAGTYAVWYNASVTIGSNNAIHRVSIYRGGSLIADSTRASQASGGGWSGMSSSMTTVQFDGNQTCDVRVRVSSGSTSVLDRTLIMIRLGN